MFDLALLRELLVSSVHVLQLLLEAYFSYLCVAIGVNEDPYRMDENPKKHAPLAVLATG
ncbi:hypothetical protein MASR2M36_34750 [Providencia sp.]